MAKKPVVTKTATKPAKTCKRMTATGNSQCHCGRLTHEFHVVSGVATCSQCCPYHKVEVPAKPAKKR